MSEADLSAMKFLVIDDEGYTRQLLSTILKGMGVGDVVFGENGADGLARYEAASGSIDFVLCDLEMPEIDGFEVVRRLRRLPAAQNPEVPILILTSHADTKFIYETAKLGVSGYMVKPPKKAALEEKIRAAIDEK